MYAIKESFYDELCRLLTDFESASKCSNDADYMSDGEWLDEFYEFCVNLQREMEE